MFRAWSFSLFIYHHPFGMFQFQAKFDWFRSMTDLGLDHRRAIKARCKTAVETLDALARCVPDVTLDSGRGKRRLLKPRVTRFLRRASSKSKEQRILEGLLQGTWMLGASAVSLSNDRLHKTFQGGLQGERTLKSSTTTQRDPGRTE